MSNDSFKVKKSLNIEPTASPTLNQDGDVAVDSSTNKLKVRLNSTTDNAVLEAASQTLTNKTLTSPVISTISNTGTLTLPTSTDTLVGRATTDTLTNKTLTAPNIDAVTFDGQGSTPSSPSAGNYKVYVDDTTSKLQILDSSGTVTAIGSGAGGSLNYIENPDAEAATTGWATYADAAGTSPVDGTGGSPTLTFTRTTSSPLRGLGSFLITKDAANRQGEGASYNFDIDSADQGKVMQITFDYAIASGTYATGDLAVYVIHDPNGTPKVIQPSAYQIENVGVNSTARLTFQTEVSAQLDYVLCFHVASTSSSAYTCKLDNIVLGPQVVPLGAPVTDWVSYTPTFTGWSANVTASGKWRRVGDSLEAEVKLALSGAPTGTLTSVTIPSGFVVDTAKLSQTDSGQAYNSSGSVFDTSGSKNWPVTVRYTSTTAVEPRVIAADEIIAYSGLINATQPVTFASGDTVTFNFRVPIVGWSSSTVVSSSADTRVVAARAYRATDQTGVNPNNSFVKLTYNTADFDTAGCFDTSNNRFTVKVPGKYRIAATAYFAGTNTLNNSYGVAIYKNGSVASYGEFSTNATATAAFSRSATTDLNLVANDYIEIYLYGQGNNSASTMTMTGGIAVSSFSVDLIQGPSQIAASEVISLVATRASTNQTIGSTSATVLIWNSAIKDSHAMLNTSTGVSTVPAPGDYSVQVNSYFTGCANEVFTIAIRKNSSVVAAYFATASSADFCFPIAYTIPNCIAGDTIDVTIDSTADTSYSLVTGTLSTLCIKRLGGVS